MVEELKTGTPPRPDEAPPEINDEGHDQMPGIEDLFDDEVDEPVVELTAEEDAGHEPAAAPEEPAPQESQPQAVAPQPAAPPAEPPVPPAQPQAQQPAQPSSEAPSGMEPPAQPAAAEPGPDLQESRKQAMAELERRYALTEEDANAIISEPEKVLPRFFSRLYVDIFENVVNSLYSQMPQMVSSVNERTAAQTKDETDFYDAWPALKDPKYGDFILRAGQMYRQLNPAASKEQFIQEVGAQAMFALRLPTESAPPAQEPPAAPPYTPPRSGPTPPPIGTKPPVNTYVEMAEEFLKDGE